MPLHPTASPPAHLHVAPHHPLLLPLAAGTEMRCLAGCVQLAPLTMGMDCAPLAVYQTLSEQQAWRAPHKVWVRISAGVHSTVCLQLPAASARQGALLAWLRSAWAKRTGMQNAACGQRVVAAKEAPPCK